ncbi:MAG: polysaccharide biosynthesis C-terminal domain-containing protein [Clostridia bacterium]|nr:polysaccharide biosynthesis C-terminal domain-containing protein [Clostridia bacterium]
MAGAKKLLHNTLLLTVASFIMRTIAVSFNVYLTEKIGADGIGLFQLISSVYSMAITFASGGIRLASMRLVADNFSDNKFSERKIMRLCLFYSLICGTFIAAIMFSFSEIIGTKWICDSRSIPSLKVLSLSLPFIAASASLGGYFTAAGKLVRYTAVQLCEQVFKIFVTVFALRNAASHGLEASCVAIVFGMTCAEIFSMLSSFILYKFINTKTARKSDTVSILKKLLRIAIPDATGAQMRSVLMTVEHLLIPVGFRKSGVNPQSSMATYGIIHGMSLPLILYPSALLSSLSGLLVPEISSRYISGKYTHISYMTARVLHIALLFSIGTAGIIYFNAYEISSAIYSESGVAFYTQILAVLIPVMYLDMTIDGILKGLDQQMSYMRYNIIDACICVVFVYILVPIFSVKGYIFVVFLSEIINFALSFRRLTIVSEVRVDLFKSIVTPTLCVVCTGMIKSIFFENIFSDQSVRIHAVTTTFFSVLLYLLFLKIFSSIEKEEILWIRKITSLRKKTVE